MKRLIALCLLLSLFLCGCSGETASPTLQFPDETETQLTTQEDIQPVTEETTQAPTEAPPEPTTQPPAQEPAYRHPLTGEPLSEPLLNRPYGVVIDNDSSQALPHWGVGDVDILWEMPHEGGTTRMIGLFSDVSKTDKLGPTRSVRPYLLSVARSYGAILVHAGGSPQGYSQLKKAKWDNLDGVQGSNAGKYYKRDRSRKVDSWHTMYITGENILQYTKERKLNNQLSEMADFGLKFREDIALDGDNATNLTISFRKDAKKVSQFTYHKDSGDYTMSQLGSNYVDGNTGKEVHFENILVLQTKVGVLDDYGRLYQELEGLDGKGYYCNGGKMISILWSRDDAQDPFQFTDTDGNPITLGVGKTYIAVTYKDGYVNAD